MFYELHLHTTDGKYKREVTLTWNFIKLLFNLTNASGGFNEQFRKINLSFLSIVNEAMRRETKTCSVKQGEF